MKVIIWGYLRTIREGLKNIKLAVKINGKTYFAKTNSKGIVTFTIHLTKKGTFNAVFRFDGKRQYNAAIKQ
ncbi:hypothetical protein IKE96_00780 [bacterium]|nr:hypothetical protein [bacterium]